MSDSGNISPSPHIALLPSSGMGHLTPFIRLAASLVHHNCKLTFITTHPIVSLSEQNLLSKFLSNFPQVISKQFHLLPFNPENFNSKDPFFLHFESIRRSAHLLSPLLSSSSSPPLSALITDISLASAILPITTELHIPNYILFTSSAKMLSFCAHFPKLADPSFQNTDSIQIPGSSSPIPKSWVPPLLLNPTNLFTTQFVENGQRLIESNGILINTFESLEPDTLAALNNGVLINGFPPVISIGPLVPCKFEQGSPLTWLDGEVDGSVVYVSFGSRTAMSRAQIRELGDGLVKSGCRFVWVVKDKKVDREDEEGLEEVMGIELMERMKERGLVVKNWVDQEMILSHKSVGGFVSHCGWNSVTESAWHGVRMLAWPQGGNQRINGDVVEKSGFGIWVKSWGWGDEKGEVVKGEEIGEKIREMMSDEGLKMRAMHVREEARRANEVGGSSKKWLLSVIEMWNK